MSAIEKCAEMLRREAGSLKACHTLDGDWRGDPAEADYHEMIALADAAIAERAELLEALEPWANEPDVDSATMLRLIKTIKYLVGIAERGEGRKITDTETPEQFVLGYVKRLEQTNQAPRRDRQGHRRSAMTPPKPQPSCASSTSGAEVRNAED